MDFYKYQGSGNDFVVVDNQSLFIQSRPVLAAHICDRHYGVGADGFIAAEPSDEADVKMAFYNADGTEATMCGNGIRCFAKFVTDRKIVEKDEFTVETGDGIKQIRILDRTLRATTVRVGMGKTGEMKEVRCRARMQKGYSSPDLPEEKDIDLIFTHFGVPHAVSMNLGIGDGMNALNEMAVAYGDSLEHAPAFAMDGSNIDFISIVNRAHILCSTWERGAGKTLACGTGACAGAAVARRYHSLKDRIKVTMPGGEVTVSFEGEEIWLEGRAVLTFVGSAPEF